MIKPINRNKLIKLLKKQIEFCESVLREKAFTKSTTYSTIYNLKKDQLPLFVNDSGLSLKLVKARLAGENIDTPAWQIEALYDEEFDFEEYKNLGTNDGVLHMAAIVLDELGEKELAERACNAQYSE